MKKLTISLRDDGKFKVDVEGRLSFEDGVALCMNTLRSIATSFIEAAPEETQEPLKGQVYDSLNLAFARFLDDLIPPDDMQIDEAAILLAQAEKVFKRSANEGKPLKEIYQDELKSIVKKATDGPVS